MLANLVAKRQLMLETRGFQLPCFSHHALPCQRTSAENFVGACYRCRWEITPTCKPNVLLQTANKFLWL